MQGPYLRKYGVETKFNFTLFGITGVDFKSDAAHAAGDTVIMKDEGAEASTTNAFVDEGIGYSITLTATEMTAARIVVYIVDQGTKVWLDTSFIVETYGHASAQHAVDLDDSVRAGLTALPAAAADAAGGLPISDAGGLDLDLKLANTNEVTAARMGALTDWIDGGRLDLLLDAIKACTDLVTAARMGALTDLIDGGRLDLLIDAIKACTDLVTAARMGALTDLIDGGRLDLLIDSIITYSASSAAWGYINSGIVFRGLVTAAVAGVSFTCGGLAGQGAGAFIDTNTPWYAYVFRDAGNAGAAPQGEIKKVTGYTSATGLFTTEAFSEAVATGDDVIILSGALTNALNTLTVVNDLHADVVDLHTDLVTAAAYIDTEVATIVTATGAVEGTITLKQALSIILAACAGKSNGGGTTTIHFRNQADDKNRITATVDGDGNRSAITLDVT